MMSHVNYAFLRGKVKQFQPAPPGNPHLWVIVEANGSTYFATINVQSSKNAEGSPIAESYLYFLIDNDFHHPIASSLLARPSGLARAETNFAAGALDYVKGNLFDPRKMRVLPTSSDGGDDLVHRLMAQLSMARDQDHELLVFGSEFRTKPGQTDVAFGLTPNEGIDNIHMAQGDVAGVEEKIHENGAWHDGGMFIVDKNTGRTMAIFLSFQTQSWQTDGGGQPLSGRTGYEAPGFDFSTGVGVPIPPQSPIAELTSLHRQPDGTSTLVLANMSNDKLDLTGWSVEANAENTLALQAATVPPGKPFVIDLPASFVGDKGGVLTLYNPRNLKVDGVSYLGGDASGGWSTSFDL